MMSFEDAFDHLFILSFQKILNFTDFVRDLFRAFSNFLKGFSKKLSSNFEKLSTSFEKLRIRAFMKAFQHKT